MKKILESDNKITGHTISFIDIDETTMHTYAKVNVMKDGEKVRELDNKEFNTYSLEDGESYNFDNFRDAQYFNQTSKPIEKTINRIKDIIQSIKDNGKMEKVIFLTAREDFDDKEVFLDTFRKFGIDVDMPNVYIERSGNLQQIKKVADRKRYVILKYLKTGLYTAVRMFDDDLTNLKTFAQLGVEVNEGKYGILDSVRNHFPRVNKLFFYPLLVGDDGSIKRYTPVSESVETEEFIFEDVSAYHGSHKNFEEFDTKFVGSGEKCQAHGWGLYFALTEETAKSYHRRISGYHEGGGSKNATDIALTYDGKSFDPKSVQGVILRKLYKTGKNSTLSFIKRLEKEAEYTKNPETYLKNIKGIYNTVSLMDPSKIKEKIVVKKGQLYTVKIPELNTYIDEDLRMSEQSPEIISSVKSVLSDLNMPFKAAGLLGRSFYSKLKYYNLENGDTINYGKQNDPKQISEFLYKYGITGIKYDGAQDGNCVVIFNKNDVKIIKKAVDYSSTDGEEMSELTKFFDDPKKLKGKRVPEKVIDWFIDNRPEKIDNNTFHTKLTPEQQLRYMVARNLLKLDYDTLESLIEKVKDSPALPFAKILFHGAEPSIPEERKIKVLEIIDSIPVEERIKYINKYGTKCLVYIINRMDDDDVKSKAEVINSFFKDVSINDIDLDNINKFNYVYPEGCYDYYIDVYKRLLWAGEFNKDDKMEIFLSAIKIDDIGMEEIKKNLDRPLKVSFWKDNLNIEKSLIPEFKEIMKYNPKGYCILSNKDRDALFIVLTMYDDEIMKSFSVVDSIEDLPYEIRYFIKYAPEKTRFFQDNVFKEALEKTAYDVDKYDPKLLQQLGSTKSLIYFNYELEQYKSKYDKEMMFNYLSNLLSSGVIELDKKTIVNIASTDIKLLRSIRNMPYIVQKALCAKNPYNIKFINNPDPRLVNELRQKIKNIDDYIDNGD